MDDSEETSGTPAISDPLTALPSRCGVKEEQSPDAQPTGDRPTEEKGSEEVKTSEEEEHHSQAHGEQSSTVENALTTGRENKQGTLDEGLEQNFPEEHSHEKSVLSHSQSQLAEPETQEKGKGSGSAAAENEEPMYRSTELGPRLSIDPRLLLDLEAEATRLTESSMELFTTLRASLYDISKVTRLSTEAYQVAVDQYSRSTDNAMRHMMQLISRCEELDRAMIPMYELAAQIKQIKRQLDVLESLCKTKR